MKINQSLETFERFEEVLYKVNAQSFDEIALSLFQFQARNNPVYADFIRHLGVRASSVQSISDIPYFPVSFFKSHDVITGTWQPEKTFLSSATTGSIRSKHHLYSEAFYHQHAQRCFEHFYGSLSGYSFFALLPSYMEQGSSSLVSMIDYFVRQSSGGGFYHGRVNELVADLSRPSRSRKVLWGVAYALLDLGEAGHLDLSDCTVVETGGMKGRRREVTREELHQKIGAGLGVKRVGSEYGMTELLSQAYSSGEGIFETPPWMKIVLRDPEDPMDKSENRPTGAINVIDLANIRTCAFVETQDLGRKSQDGSFEVLGRLDNSDVRGCNLLVG